nr:GNAT family N-acetyltransferase [Paenibacillus hamazuiensis]
MPVIDTDLAKRLERSELEYITSRISSIGERSGNPEGVEIRKFGGATAFYTKTMPWRSFNGVVGLTPDDIDQIGGIAEFYRERQRSFEIAVNPCSASPELLKALAACGLYQKAFHSVLYGPPSRDMSPLPEHVRIDEVTDEREFGQYAEIHCVGFGMSADHKHHFVNNNIGLLHRPGWKFFLARIQETPAAVGVMLISGGIASFTLAATAPEFRRRGLHTALLHRRMHEAHLAGCELVTAQAGFGSTSQNNMERTGMQMAWTRAVWEPL